MQIYGGTLRIVGIRDRFNPLPAVIACAVIATICLVIALHNLPAAKRTRSKAIKKEPTP